MKSTLLVLLVLLPGLALSQSLNEVAKKGKERREKNKQEGKEALIISEDQLSSEQAQAGGSGQVEVEGGSTGSPRHLGRARTRGKSTTRNRSTWRKTFPKAFRPTFLSSKSSRCSSA